MTAPCDPYKPLYTLKCPYTLLRVLATPYTGAAIRRAAAAGGSACVPRVFDGKQYAATALAAALTPAPAAAAAIAAAAIAAATIAAANTAAAIAAAIAAAAIAAIAATFGRHRLADGPGTNRRRRR